MSAATTSIAMCVLNTKKLGYKALSFLKEDDHGGSNKVLRYLQRDQVVRVF
jgi:hypothetical protein